MAAEQTKYTIFCISSNTHSRCKLRIYHVDTAALISVHFIKYAIIGVGAFGAVTVNLSALLSAILKVILIA